MVGLICAAVGNITDAAGRHTPAGGLITGSGSMCLRFLQHITAGMVNAMGGIVNVLNILLLGCVILRVNRQIRCVANLASALADASGNAAFANALHYGDTTIFTCTEMLLYAVFYRILPRA